MAAIIYTTCTCVLASEKESSTTNAAENRKAMLHQTSNCGCYYYDTAEILLCSLLFIEKNIKAVKLN